VLTVLWPAASAVGTGHLYDLAFVPLNALINYFLLKGVRWLWWLLVASGALGILSDLTGGIAWYYLVGLVLTLALLLLPKRGGTSSSAKTPRWPHRGFRPALIALLTKEPSYSSVVKPSECDPERDQIPEASSGLRAQEVSYGFASRAKRRRRAVPRERTRPRRKLDLGRSAK
jgi:hypothetical protein